MENLRILGSHPGKTLATCGDIVIEERAKLHLDVYGDHIVVAGRVTGAVVASSSVEVGPTGRVTGDITAPQIVVRDGAQIDGHCRMTGFPDYGQGDDLSEEGALGEGELLENGLVGDGEAGSEAPEEPPRPVFRPRPLRPPPGVSKPIGFERVDRSTDAD